MMTDYRPICGVGIVILLNIPVVLRVLGGLVLVVIIHHGRYSPSTSIHAAMLPLLVALVEHAVVYALCRRMGVRRSRR